MSVLTGKEGGSDILAQGAEESPKTFPISLGGIGESSWASPKFEGWTDLFEEYPIRLWEVFDDPHYARLVSDEDYFREVTEQTPLGGMKRELPGYDELTKGAASQAVIGAMLGNGPEEAGALFDVHRMGVSIALRGYPARTNAELYDVLGQAARMNAELQERQREMVLKAQRMPTVPSLLHDLFNLGVKNVAEPVLSGAEGVTRGTGHTLDDVASENERRSDEELARDARELRGYLSGPRLAIGGPGLETAAVERLGDIERVQGNRAEGREDSANRGGLRAGAQKAGEGLLATADATGALRQRVSEALPVSEEVENSLGGQMVAAIAQMPANLAMYRVPGLGPLMNAGQVYNETYYDALAHGATPKQAHRAALNGLPAAVIDVAMDKLMLARILKPLVGKMKVKELRKTLFLTGLTGGVSEGLQQAMMNFNAKYLSGYDPERLLDEDVIRSLVIGMLVDSTVSAGGQAVTSSKVPQKFNKLLNRKGAREESMDSQTQRKREIEQLNDLFSVPGRVVRKGDSVQSVLGFDLSDRQLSNLAGGHKGAKVFAESEAKNELITLTVESPNIENLIRTLKREPDGSLLLYNVTFKKSPAANLPKGFGTYVLSNEVREAMLLRVNKIETLAAGSIDTPNDYVGYEVWAKLGFDFELPVSMKNLLPNHLQHASTLQQLRQTSEGRDWWRINGGTQWMEFDLNPDSSSIKVLDNYLEENGYRKL